MAALLSGVQEDIVPGDMRAGVSAGVTAESPPLRKVWAYGGHSVSTHRVNYGRCYPDPAAWPRVTHIKTHVCPRQRFPSPTPDGGSLPWPLPLL